MEVGWVMQNALVIIDMQPKFNSSSKKETIDECRKLIRKAKSAKDVIIVVEYAGYGSTIPQLKRLLNKKTYPHIYFVEKSFDDGSEDIYKVINSNKLSIKEMTICGVNSDACVQFTSETLADMGYQVKVVKKACNTNHKWYGTVWGSYKRMPNLVKV